MIDEDLLDTDALYRLYNMKDTYATHESAYSLIEELKEYDLLGFYDRIVQPLAEIIIDINLTGLYVDIHMREEAVANFHKEVEELQEALNYVAGQEINVNTVSFSDFLYHDLGLKCPSRTKKGKERTDEDTLLKVAKATPDVALVISMALEIKKKNKMVGTFLPDSWLDPDGRVYPNYRIGPATGRLGCKKPDLQNIPEGIARKVFCAPPGYVFAYADYSQVELRILALLANDEPLLETFRKGEDIHDRNARDLFGIQPHEKVGPRQRYFAKTFVYGLNYGGTIETIKGRGSEVFHDIPTEVMDQAAERYFAAHPNIHLYRLQIGHEMKTKRRLVNAFGRPRIFYDKPKEAIRQGYNFPMQSGAADLINSKMVELVKVMPGRLCLQVHDSLMFEVPEDEGEEAVKILKEVLESPVKEFNNYCFPAKASLGTSWGDF